MSKYIIELKDDIQVVQKVGVTENGNAFVMNFYKDQLEELKLNSDYINKHYGDLQDTAYQRGLEDAWECAKKIALMDTETSENVTGYFGLFRIMENLTPMQAIAKLKAYEEKQKAEDKIKVGDEVNWIGDCFIVTRIFQPRTQKEQCDGIDDDGCVYHDVLMDDLEKTGRHFDIGSILKEMQS